LYASPLFYYIALFASHSCAPGNSIQHFVAAAHPDLPGEEAILARTIALDDFFDKQFS
jgi:hypothetical protein